MGFKEIKKELIEKIGKNKNIDYDFLSLLIQNKDFNNKKYLFNSILEDFNYINKYYKEYHIFFNLFFKSDFKNFENFYNEFKKYLLKNEIFNIDLNKLKEKLYKIYFYDEIFNFKNFVVENDYKKVYDLLYNNKINF